MNQWFEVNCPNCKTPNLIDNGDVSDQTIGDVEGFKCYACSKKFLFDEDNEYEPIPSNVDGYFDEGKPVPK